VSARPRLNRGNAAIPARRLSAYLIDWFIGILAGVGLLTLAAAVLLAASDLDRRDPPDWSIDAALVLMSLWLPCWFLYVSLAWASRSKTVGMSLAGIRVVTCDGVAPGVWRALWRALLLALFSGPILLAPLGLALAFSLGTAGPLPVASAIVLAIMASAAALLSSVIDGDGRAWHDRLSGTCVRPIDSEVSP
jgi:uncharacterized RDD family membrane protein YckC